MIETPGPTDPSVAGAEGQLARLGVQVESMQALLVRLLQDVVRAEARLDQSQSARIVEVNEQLVLSSLASRIDTEAAVAALAATAEPSARDALTGLPNRALLADRAGQAIARARYHRCLAGLILLALDEGPPRDALGRGLGEKVVRAAVARISSVVREIDTVSRHGEDAFVILLSELNQRDEAGTAAERLVAAVGAPVELDGQAVRVTARVGIALYPDDGEDFDALLARAAAVVHETGTGTAEEAGREAGPEPGSRVESDSTTHRPAPGTARAAARAARTFADLREANEKLVLAVLNARQLQAAAELARQRQAAFLAAVAEELRNPTAPIRIASAMLGRQAGDEPLLPRVLSIVERQLTHMSRLVGNLVDASSVETGGLTLERRPVDMVHVIDAAIAAQRPLMAERAQRFEMQRPPGALEVLGDADRLELVVSNVLDNASKHTHDGGRIGLAVVVGADSLTLTVSDNGIGITPQVMPFIFEPFVQDTPALGSRGIGLGIGLTVARTMVQAHGGSLVAHSAGTGRGSQFVITLPRATRVEATVAAESAASRQTSEGAADVAGPGR